MQLLSIRPYKAQLTSVLPRGSVESLNRNVEFLADAFAVCRTVFNPQLTRPIDYFQAQLMELKFNEQDVAVVDFNSAFKLRHKFASMCRGLEKIRHVLNASLAEKVSDTILSIDKCVEGVFLELRECEKQHSQSSLVFQKKSPSLMFVNWNIEFASSPKYFTEPCSELTGFTHIHLRHIDIDIVHAISTPMSTVEDLIMHIHNMTGQSTSKPSIAGIGCDITEIEVDPQSPHCLIVFIKSGI